MEVRTSRKFSSVELGIVLTDEEAEAFRAVFGDCYLTTSDTETVAAKVARGIAAAIPSSYSYGAGGISHTNAD